MTWQECRQQLFKSWTANIVLIAFCFTLPHAIGIESAIGEDWPGFLGTNRDGKSNETGIKMDWSAGKLNILWTADLGEGYGAGSVSGGRFFIGDRVKDQSRLTCFDAKTGESLWVHKYETDYVDMYGFDGGPRCSPLIHEGRVYMFGVEGMLYCLDVDNGAEIWKVDTAKEFGVIQNFFGVGSTPVIFQENLLVMVGGSPQSSQKVQRGALNLVESNGSAIVAFDKRTGEVTFQSGNDLASYSSPVIRQINGQDCCLAFCRQNLIGLDPSNGKIKFEFPWRAKKLESVNASTPLVIDNQVFITESYGPGSALLDLTSGKPDVVWKDSGRDKAMEAHWNTPIEIDGHIYGCHGQYRNAAELRCIESASGKVKWSQPGLDRTSLTYVDGHFVCLSESGGMQLLKVNSESFDPVTTYEEPADKNVTQASLEYPCWAAPVIADGLMYIRGKNRLVCFELSQP